MKKLLLPVFCLSLNLVQAQVTITADDMPQAGEIYLSVQAFETDFGDPGLTSGEAVFWDFSGLTADVDLLLPYVPVSEVPFAFQLIFNNPDNPSYANLAMPVSDFGVGVEVPVTDGHQFYLVNDSGFYDCGVAGNLEGFPVFGNRNPTDRLFTLPLEYGMSQDSSYSFMQIIIPELGYGNMQLWRENSVDAWGTVVTPEGEFEALRVRSVVNRTDTIVAEMFGINQVIVHPETVEYRWMAPGQGIPVLQINFSEGIVTQVQYRSDDTTIGIADNKILQEVKAYPNPASDYVKLNIPAEEVINDLFLTNLTGQVIHPEFIRNGNEVTVQLNAVQAGIYRLVMVSNSSKSGSWIMVQPLK